VEFVLANCEKFANIFLLQQDNQEPVIGFIKHHGKATLESIFKTAKPNLTKSNRFYKQ